VKPILLLDVDGVLNIMPGVMKKRVSPPAGFHEEHVGMGNHLRVVLVNPEIGRRLGSLLDDVDIWWFTSWGSYANMSLGPLFDLPPLPFYRAPETHAKVVTFRHLLRRIPLMQPLTDSTQRLLAVDDVLGEDSVEEAKKWGPVYDYSTIQTDPAVGLRHSDVDLIIDWARA
jgi:hypothetical protein